MEDSSEIIYREFYDVPRIFLVQRGNAYVLFESHFDDHEDEYLPYYEVSLLPNLSNKTLEGSWVNLSQLAIRPLGTVPVKAVCFDETRRRFIHNSVFDSLEAVK